MPDTFDYDAELRRYQARLFAALDIGSRDRVLDVGCGTGQTTRAAARTAIAGDALGVDISERMLVRARELSDAEGLDNVCFEYGDAQSYPFPADRFSLGISRFGTMFFADPVAAFANIARALRPGAQFVQLVWQDGSRQEWELAIGDALAPDAARPAVSEAAFSLAEPVAMCRIMTESGFTDLAFTELCEPIYYGPNVASARESVLTLETPTDLLTALPDDRIAPALRRLDEALASHETDDGVWFDSRAWLVTARAV